MRANKDKKKGRNDGAAYRFPFPAHLRLSAFICGFSARLLRALRGLLFNARMLPVSQVRNPLFGCRLPGFLSITHGIG